MAKPSTSYVLYDAMKKAGDSGLTREQIAELLNVQVNSVGVYLFGLRKFYNAKFDTIKSGRKILCYKLVDAEKMNVPTNRRMKKPLVTAKAVKVIENNSVVAPDKDLEISEFTDREFNDIKASLGLL